MPDEMDVSAHPPLLPTGACAENFIEINGCLVILPSEF